MKTALHTIPTYYLVVTALLMIQAIFTVYQGGLVVGNGAKVSQLERQQRALQTQTLAVKQQLSHSNSLLNIQSTDLYNQFQPMANVIVSTQNNAVALR